VISSILVAGIGNIFLGDDGFGVEVAKELSGRDLPEHVKVEDFGIRGMDLVYELLEDYETVVFVDAAPRGGNPGTVYLIEPDVDPNAASVETHGMDPVKVLSFARLLGAKQPRTFVVGCEPLVLVTGDEYEDVLVELSDPVRAAVREAADMVEALVKKIDAQPTGNPKPETCSPKPSREVRS
jgi:hydrogenase maturation protease